MASFSDIIERLAGRANINRNINKYDNAYTGNSVKQMTKDLILQFPILVSQNISNENVATLAAGFEVENTIMLRLLLQNDFGALTNGSGNLINSLRLIHTNIEGGAPALAESLTDTSKSLALPIEEKFCKWSLNESTLPKYLIEASLRSEDKLTSGGNGTLNLGFADVNFSGKNVDTTTTTVEFEDKAPFNPDMFKKVNDLQPTFIKVKISIANSTEMERSGGVNVNIPVISNVLKSNDSKKYGLSGGRNISRTSLDEKEVIFGVKCIAHPLRSEDIIFNIGNEFKNSTLFKFIKWTTGEYGLLKGISEIVFDFSNMKNTGIQAARTSNYWWYKLRKLRNINKQVFHSSSEKKNAPIKTASLIITKDEVDFINTKYRIDLSMPKHAQKLMNSLFLLNFAYIDESTKEVYLYDEPSASFTIKKISDFKKQKKPDPINIDDIKSLFGR